MILKSEKYLTIRYIFMNDMTSPKMNDADLLNYYHSLFEPLLYGLNDEKLLYPHPSYFVKPTLKINLSVGE